MEFNFFADRSKLIKRKENAGEDAPPVSKSGILIVCDGTGATGMSKHEYNGEYHTSAYLGSRKTSEIVNEYLTANYDRIINSAHDRINLKNIIAELGTSIRSEMHDFVSKNNFKLTVRGRAFKLLPTTLAAAIYKIYEDHIDIIALSAGDSRVLLWSPEDGLQQLSVDDVENGYDAFSDVSNTNNCISADNDFRINFVVHSIDKKKCVLFATSDGFTDPIKPFDQERYLIQWLGNCDCVLDVEHSNLKDYIEHSLDADRVAGFTGKDDCSIAGTIIGYENDEELKNSLRSRFGYVANTFSVPYRDLDKKCKEAMDNYNSAGIEKRRCIEQVNTKIKEKIMDGVIFLLPSKCELNPMVYEFLSAQSCINTEIRRIHNELEEKQKRAQGKLMHAEQELKEHFIKLLKYYCFVAAQNGVNTGLPPEIMGHLDSHIKSINARKEVTDSYNQALFKIKKVPEINLDSFSSINAEEIRYLCSNLINATTEIARLNRMFDESNRAITNFFSVNNAQITEMFDRYRKQDFIEFYVCIENLRPTKFLGIFSRNKDDEAEYANLHRMKNEFENIFSRVQKIQNEIDSIRLSDEERLSRYKVVARNNINELINAVMENQNVFANFVGEEKTSFEARMASIDVSSEKAKTLIELKNQLWKKYKPTYELFLHADIDYVMIPKNCEG